MLRDSFVVQLRVFMAADATVSKMLHNFFSINCVAVSVPTSHRRVTVVNSFVGLSSAIDVLTHTLVTPALDYCRSN